MATSPKKSSPDQQELPVATNDCPGYVLIIDTETTGLDPAEFELCEIGAILFDVQRRAVVQQLSFLLPVWHNDAEHINGINPDVTRFGNQPVADASELFIELLRRSDALVAHNTAFDRRWIDAWLIKRGRDTTSAMGKPWICTMEDIRWPATLGLKGAPSVRDLALAHGVPVWAAHRALTDCTYLAHVFERCYDLEALLQGGLEPRELYKACVSYDDREKARAAGFRWNEPVPKAWSRRLSAREAAELPFPVVPCGA